MLSLFLYFLSYNNLTEVQRFEVDTKGRTLFTIRSRASCINEDGSILIGTKSTIYHFNPKGQLIRLIGRHGTGPNEFESIRTAVWTGQNYLIVDGRTLRTTITDNSGTFLKYKNRYFSRLLSSKGEYFYVGGVRIKQLIGERPSYLGRFSISNDELTIDPRRFHPLSNHIVGLFYNYVNHYVSTSKNKVFVVDEVAPVVYSYDKKLLKETEPVSLKLPQFVLAPPEMPRSYNGHNGSLAIRKKVEAWQESWSHILGFDYSDGRYYFAYTLPTGVEGAMREVIVCQVDAKTKEAVAASVGTRDFLGFQEGKAFILESDDESEDKQPKYTVSVYLWP